MSGRSCFLEFYSAAKGSEHQKSDKEEESASFLVVPSWFEDWTTKSSVMKSQSLGNVFNALFAPCKE